MKKKLLNSNSIKTIFCTLCSPNRETTLVLFLLSFKSELIFSFIRNSKQKSEKKEQTLFFLFVKPFFQTNPNCFSFSFIKKKENLLTSKGKGKERKRDEPEVQTKSVLS